MSMAKPSHALASILLLACGFFTAAQTPPTQSTSSLLVNVLDRKGNAVRNLTKDNFRVKVNGHPAAVVAADYGLAPRRIVVLLDMSGSMAGRAEQNNKWQVAREAIEDLITETPADVQVALITFSTQVHDVFDFSQNRASIAAWLKQGSSQRSDINGATAFYDALVAATKLLQPARPGDAIYAITDGGDNHSHVSRTETRKLLLQSGIRLFLFLFAEPTPLELQSEAGPVGVLELAHETGGFVFGVAGERGLDLFDFNYDAGEKTQDRIKRYTQALNVQVNGFYTLHLETPIRPSKLGKVSLEIVDSTGKASKEVAWTYQRFFSPPDLRRLTVVTEPPLRNRPSPPAPASPAR